MIALTSLEKLHQVKEDRAYIKVMYPELHERLVYLISLTRQLQFRYPYLGCLLTDEDADKYKPEHTKESVLALFLQEIEKFKDLERIDVIQSLFTGNHQCGYNNICLLILGTSPEFLKGVRSAF